MILETARRVLEIESVAVRELVDRIDDSFARAVELLTACRGRVVVTGMGKSGLIGQKVAATFSSTGMPAYFMHPAEAVHGDLGMIVRGDVVLAISNSGETGEIVRLLEVIRRLDARIIGLIGVPGSTLADNADVFLDVGVREEACSLDLVPTASTTAALAMGDALAVACYESRGFTAREFATFHPGGRLAHKLRRVSDLMHTGDGVPRVSPAASIAEAVREMSAKRLGVTCIVEDGDALVGILTDGDLRRRLMDDPSPMDGTAGEAATPHPATIQAESLASEALRIMEQKKITSLPVVDADDALVGVVQIHDLWRTELF